MAVTYDKIAYDEIELALRKIISSEFTNVYIGQDFKMLGTQCIKINLESSTSVEQATNYEQRDYGVNLRYYHMADTNNEMTNKGVKDNIDRLRKHLLDNQVSSTYKWSALIVDEINYNVQDSENEDNAQLHISELNISITHHNAF